MERGEFALLHRESDRFSDYPKLDSFFWAPDIESWATADPATIRTVLKDRRFEVIDFRGVVAMLSDRVNVDFESTAKVLDHVALGMKDAEHHRVRKTQTLFIKANSDAALANFRAAIDKRFETLFGADGTVDLALDLVAPAIAALFSPLSEERETLEGNPSPSQIFDRMLSINRRKMIDAFFRTRLRDFPSGMSEEETLMRISLSAVGADTIYGSFCQSLMAVIQAHDGQKISDMMWPDEMPHTGIPCVDRIVAEDMDFRGAQIKAGDRVRLYVEAFVTDPASRQSDLFGLGAHVCLGKALSMKAWTELVTRLRRTQAHARLVAYEYRRPDFLFNAPSNFTLEIQHG